MNMHATPTWGAEPGRLQECLQTAYVKHHTSGSVRDSQREDRGRAGHPISSSGLCASAPLCNSHAHTRAHARLRRHSVKTTKMVCEYRTAGAIVDGTSQGTGRQTPRNREHWSTLKWKHACHSGLNLCCDCLKYCLFLAAKIPASCFGRSGTPDVIGGRHSSESAVTSKESVVCMVECGLHTQPVPSTPSHCNSKHQLPKTNWCWKNVKKIASENRAYCKIIKLLGRVSTHQKYRPWTQGCKEHLTVKAWSWA